MAGGGAAVRVRPRTADDVAACVELLRLVQSVDGYPLVALDLPVFLRSARERAAWVAERDGAVVGHVALHTATDHPTTEAARTATGLPVDGLAVVARLFVAPSARRAGVAATLVRTATEAARSEGRRGVLDVGQQVTGAVRLYESLGWRRVAPLQLDLGVTLLDLWVYVAPDAPARDRPGPVAPTLHPATLDPATGRAE